MLAVMGVDIKYTSYMYCMYLMYLPTYLRHTGGKHGRIPRHDIMSERMTAVTSYLRLMPV
jgi:hypothetical protein